MAGIIIGSNHPAAYAHLAAFFASSEEVAVSRADGKKAIKAGVKVGIVGATGDSGGELLGFLAGHADVAVATLPQMSRDKISACQLRRSDHI